jgi:hypothetical protein
VRYFLDVVLEQLRTAIVVTGMPIDLHVKKPRGKIGSSVRKSAVLHVLDQSLAHGERNTVT